MSVEKNGGAGSSSSSMIANDDNKKEVSTPHKIQDTILVGWLLENLQLLLLATLFLTIGPLKDFINPDATYLSMFFKSWIGFIGNSFLISELLNFNVHYLYGHIPFYNPSQKPTPIHYIPHRLMDEISQMGIAAIFFAALPKLGYIPSTSTQSTSEAGILILLPNGILGGIFHLLIARLSMDTIFHALHQGLLHHPQSWWYTNCHKNHHQHHWPRLDTNYYFHALDRFLEGPTSVLFGLIMGFFTTVLVFGTKPSIHEVSYCFVMLVHNLFASHAGKHLPSCSFFPPLSIVYRSLLLASTQQNDHNIHHHFVHHEKASCNYGINGWTDYIMGTRYEDVFLSSQEKQQ